MELNRMRTPPGSRQARKRVGRGEGSGLGKTSGKGHKGQKARSGPKIAANFEGGQIPLARRLPKFGFTNIFRTPSVPVNLRDLERFKAGSVVDRKSLQEAGLFSAKYKGPFKVLGTGKLTKSLTVKATAFSKTAAEAIQKAGGTAEVLK